MRVQNMLNHALSHSTSAHSVRTQSVCKLTHACSPYSTCGSQLKLILQLELNPSLESESLVHIMGHCWISYKALACKLLDQALPCMLFGACLQG